MPAHSEQRWLPYTPAQLYAVVADLESYPDFLPWVRAVRIRSRETQGLIAEMAIGVRHIRETFKARVTLEPERRIRVDYLDGPLHYFDNRWEFEPAEDGGCRIDFHIDFKFRSRLLQNMAAMAFHHALERVVSRFQQRAVALYGADGRPEAGTAAE